MKVISDRWSGHRLNDGLCSGDVRSVVERVGVRDFLGSRSMGYRLIEILRFEIA
jgi:hypothetical protein